MDTGSRYSVDNLGRLEDLPADYRERLTAHNLVPLWPSLRAVLPPGKPRPRTTPVRWSFAEVRELLIRAGELTPIEKAERRVLVLANPGHGLTNMQASSTIYMGIQLILPGELAPNHRHTPNAVRMVIEGKGAYTTVEGEPCEMLPGDLVLTPSGMWHEHHHEGEGPFIWLDVLDLPLFYYLETSWVEEGRTQAPVRPRDRSHTHYVAPGLAPEVFQVRDTSHHPLLRYPWARTRDALLALAQSDAKSPVQLRYINPENGAPIFPSLGFSALMLRPAERLTLPKRTSAVAFHAISGEGSFEVAGQTPLTWQDKDTMIAPGYEEVVLTNASRTEPAFLFCADDAPLHEHLRVF